MAAVPITITGMEVRDDGTSGNVTIVGMASLTGLGVGGGPAPGGQPPTIWDPKPPYVDIGGPGPQPGGPVGIWGPNDPRPTQPIVIPPGPTAPPGSVSLPIAPGGPNAGFPDVPGYPPYVSGGPIVGLLPIDPTPPPEGAKPPPPGGGWGYSPDYGWGYFPGTGGAGPRR